MVEGFYLPRLSSEDLAIAVAWGFHVFDSAPRFASWMVDALLVEQVRRLRSRQGEAVETQLLTMPAAKWTTEEIGQALTVTMVLSYAVKNYATGMLVDWMTKNITAAAKARMLRMERETCQQ